MACKTLSNKLCTLSRKHPGHPIQVGVRCRFCSEYRCKTHCKCGRNKTAVGRNGPRNLTAENKKLLEEAALASAKDKQQTLETESLAPRGAPSPTSCATLACEEWWQSVYKHVKTATELELSSAMFRSFMLLFVVFGRPLTENSATPPTLTKTQRQQRKFLPCLPH